MATPGDKKFVLEQLQKYRQYCEDLSYIFRVDIYPPIKFDVKNNEQVNPTKKRKAAKRILAFSAYRLFLVKRGAFKTKKVTKNIHLYDLHEINSADTNSAIFLFRGKHANKSIEMKTGQIAEIIKVMRELYASITVGYSQQALMKLNIIPENLKEIKIENPKDKLADGLLHLYLAQSAYFTTKVSKEFVHHIEDQVQFDNKANTFSSTQWLQTDENPLNQLPSTLELHKIPGIIRGSEISFHLPPVAAALRHNTYFKTLILKDIVNLKEIILFIANIIRHNKTLRKLELVNLEASKFFLALGDMLRDNKFHSIEFISLSGSKISNMGILSVSIALEHFKHSLIGLDLSNCNISGKRAEILMNAFRRNYAMSLSIEYLNLSANKFDTEGSKAFEKWLFESKEYSNMKKLVLANSQISMVSVCRSFRSLKYLNYLDVSGNKLDRGSIELLAVAIEESHTLRYLNISNCSLKCDLLQKIILIYLTNRLLTNVFLDISYNQLSNKEAPQIAAAFKKSYNLHTLKMCGFNKLKADGLTILLKSLSRKKTLDSLILDNSFSKSIVSEEIAKAFYLFLKFTPSVKALSISGGFDGILCALLEKLSKNQSLIELNIENNHLADKGAFVLAEMLRKNSTLLLLRCDKNSIGINGWRSVLLSFKVNKTLLHLPYPWSDLQRILSSSSNPRLQTRIKTILLDIQHEISIHFPSSAGGMDGTGDVQSNDDANAAMRKYILLDLSLNHYNDTIINDIPSDTVKPLPVVPDHLLVLQKEAQDQFEDYSYWLVNDNLEINAPLTTGSSANSMYDSTSSLENIEWVDAIGNAEFTIGNDYGNAQMPNISNMPLASSSDGIPVNPRLSIRDSLGGLPARPLPSPLPPRPADPSAFPLPPR